jgi:hypothetical protein
MSSGSQVGGATSSGTNDVYGRVPEVFLRGYLGEPGYGFAGAQVPDLEVDGIRAVAGR